MLSGELLGKIIECLDKKIKIKASLLEEISRINEEKIKVRFPRDVSGENLSDQIKSFVFLMDDSGFAIVEFLDLLRAHPKYQLRQELTDLHTEIMQSFEKQADGSFTLKEDLFDRPMLIGRLPFINRKSFKKELFRLVHNKSQPIVLIDGPSRSGKSYLSFYMGEIKKALNCFEWIPIDLSRLAPNEVLFAADLAHELDSKLGMDYDFDLDRKNLFKISPFINELKRFLNAQDRLHCFFIDHFDVPEAGDLTRMINHLLRMIVLDGTKNCCVFLSGFQDVDSLDFEIQFANNRLELSPFGVKDIEEFLPKMFKAFMRVCEEKEVEVDFSEADFTSMLERKIGFSTLLEDETSSVQEIGRSLTRSYQELVTNL